MLISFNFSVLVKDGYKNRLPEIIKEIFTQQTWNLLKNENNEICHHNPEGCQFNIFSDKKIYVIGDSNIASINFDLKEKLVGEIQFITYTFGGCVYFQDLIMFLENQKRYINIAMMNFFKN